MTIGQDDQGGQEEGQDAPDDPEPHSEGAPIEFAQSNFHLEHLPEPPLIKILGERREKHIEQDRQSEVSEVYRRKGRQTQTGGNARDKRQGDRESHR